MVTQPSASSAEKTPVVRSAPSTMPNPKSSHQPRSGRKPNSENGRRSTKRPAIHTLAVAAIRDTRATTVPRTTIRRPPSRRKSDPQGTYPPRGRTPQTRRFPARTRQRRTKGIGTGDATTIAGALGFGSKVYAYLGIIPFHSDPTRNRRGQGTTIRIDLQSACPSPLSYSISMARKFAVSRIDYTTTDVVVYFGLLTMESRS